MCTIGKVSSCELGLKDGSIASLVLYMLVNDPIVCVHARGLEKHESNLMRQLSMNNYMPWTCDYRNCSLWVWLWLFYADWIECHVPTHLLDRVLSGVTFWHIYWIRCHVPTHIESGVTFWLTNSLGVCSMRELLVIMTFMSTCYWHWEIVCTLKR